MGRADGSSSCCTISERNGGAAEIPQRIEHDGAALDVDPVRSYEHDVCVSSVPTSPTSPCPRLAWSAAATCCSISIARFAAKRSRVLRECSESNGLLVCGTDWVLTTEARYFTYRKRNGALAGAEFNFSLDNLAPLGIIPWYTLHDDDPELALLVDMVAILRADRGFIGAFMERSDALRAQMNLVPRGPDGYYLAALPDGSPVELWTKASQLGDMLGQDFGAEAVTALARHGFDARLNSVGHIAVTIPVS